MKKRILFLSNFSLANTGFGKAQKNLLSRLYKTGKYELAEIGAGACDLDPNTQKLPWRVYGVLPKSNEEKQRWDAAPDDNVKRCYAYGLFRFDEAVADFKPDILVVHEDLWCDAAWIKNSQYWGKFTLVQWSPLDAEPLTEDFAVFLKDIKYIYTYGEWSKGIGVNAGLPQTKVATLGVDHEIFRPLDNVASLRVKLGIAPSDYVVLMVARLQVRKKFETLFESLLHIQKTNPELYSHIKILPFCSFKDPAGFDILKFWRSRKIPTEKIIIPYLCTNCREYHIAKNYVDNHPNERHLPEGAKCPCCGADSCLTPSVTNGLTDEQLNEIYNISDLSVLVTSNEGQGQGQVEAKSAGKITISTKYSTSGEVTLGNDSGLAFNYSLYMEMGTLFYKAHLTPQEVGNRIIEVYNLPEEKKREMEKRARELVLDKYNWDKLAKDWEGRLDAIEPLNIDWNAKPKEKNPNPDAKLPLCLNDLEWVVALYKHILDADIAKETNGKPETNQGVQYWLWELTNQKRTKEDIEKFFRSTAQKEAMEKNKVTLKDLLDPNDSKRILYCVPRSAGDNFLSTAVVAGLKEKYPEYSIYVACEGQFAGIWQNNPNIKKVIEFNPIMMVYGAMEGMFNKGLFDICFMPTILTQSNPPSWHHSSNTKSFLL